MKGMDNNAPHGFFGSGSDSYEQMMLMGGGQQGYGGIPSWMGGTPGGFSTSVAGVQTGIPTLTGGFPSSVAGVQTGIPTFVGGRREEYQ